MTDGITSGGFQFGSVAADNGSSGVMLEEAAKPGTATSMQGEDKLVSNTEETEEPEQQGTSIWDAQTATGTWKCSGCLVPNKAAAPRCKCCDAVNPDAKKGSGSEGGGEVGGSGFVFGSMGSNTAGSITSGGFQFGSVAAANGSSGVMLEEAAKPGTANK